MEEKNVEPEKKIKPDSFFDGHLEIDITQIAPKEKLLYLSRQIRLKRFIEQRVIKIT